MKKVIAVALLVVSAMFLTHGTASANYGSDPCGHGKTGKPCRQDPNPHVQDCITHGKGGINEDHCADPSADPTPTPTQPAPSVTPTPTPTQTPTVVPTVSGTQRSRRTPSRTQSKATLAMTGTNGYAIAVIALFGLVFLFAGYVIVKQVQHHEHHHGSHH